MKTEDYNKHFIFAILFSLVFTIAIVIIVNEDKDLDSDCNIIQRDTIYKEIEQLKEIRDTIIDTRYKKQIEYVRIIDTIYLLDSASVDAEYQRTISSLDSLNKSGFFRQN